jgi:hypothetical protein
VGLDGSVQSASKIHRGRSVIDLKRAGPRSPENLILVVVIQANNFIAALQATPLEDAAITSNLL